MSEEKNEIETEAIDEEKPTIINKKKKKLVRRRKTKKEKENPINVALRLAVESGKVGFGARKSISAAASGEPKVFVVAKNTPKDTLTKIKQYSNKTSIPILEFDGNTIELGSVCGKPFPVSVLSVYDIGNSNILKLAEEKENN